MANKSDKTKYVTKTFTFEGKRYYVRGKDPDDANAKAALKLRDLEEGRREISHNTLVSVWAEEWLETYKEPSVNTKQYKDIQRVIKNFIDPAIGSMRIASVKPVHLQKILNGLTDYSNSYVSKIYDIIRQIFAEAYRNNLVLRNPAEALRKPRGKSKRPRRPITDRERELTLQVAEYHRGGLFVLIMLYCGLRPGEVAALRWKDVDFEHSVLHVHQALKSDDTIGKPKTISGVRDVPIPFNLAKRLRLERGNASDLVCTNTRGDKYTESSVQAMFENFRREMNIAAGCRVFRNQVLPPFAIADDLTLYCYRHTYCTDLQAAGVPINVAKELMGHSNISVTAQIYTHKSDVAFRNAARLIDNYVRVSVAPKPEPLENTGNNV